LAGIPRQGKKGTRFVVPALPIREKRLQEKRLPGCIPTRFFIRKEKTAHYFYHESRICQEKSPKASVLGNDDGKVRAEEGAHPALLALFHIVAFRGKISAGIHLFRLLQDLGRTKFDADATPLTILVFNMQLDHTGSRLHNGLKPPWLRTFAGSKRLELGVDR
jgi:hypothetical protein